MALIELDLDAPAGPPPGGPPARSFRSAAVVLAAVLVLTLGGAAPIRPVLWRHAGLVPLGGVDTTYQLVDGVLYTLDGNTDGRTVTAWEIDPVRRRWSLSMPPGLDESGTVLHDDPALLAGAGRQLVLSTARATTVIDPATGQIRWAVPVPVLTADGSSAVIEEPRFAAGTVYDQSSGAPGPLYFSADGVPHTRPPERTVLHGLDLATGRERWRRTEPGSIYAVPSGDPDDGYLVISADRVTLLDGATGAVQRSRPIPRLVGDSYPAVIADVVLIASGSTVQAISRRTFATLWQRTESIGVRADDNSCLGLLCDTGRDAITVLDPATGARRWTAPTSVLLIARGPDVLEELAESERPFAVHDPVTGAVRLDLRRWDTVALSDSEDPILLFRAQTGTGRAEFGAVVPGAGRVQPLGRTSKPVRACSSDAAHVACRIDDGVEVWAYRA